MLPYYVILLKVDDRTETSKQTNMNFKSYPKESLQPPTPSSVSPCYNSSNSSDLRETHSARFTRNKCLDYVKREGKGGLGSDNSEPCNESVARPFFLLIPAQIMVGIS
uniref:Uncharacterized protein n=1 Tax=Cacopsylla melanoneura TaxID=428564 RepID=A0A8D9BTA3_9HEMI